MKKRYFPKLSWRMVWYSVVIWFLTIIIGSFVILPWFYLAFPVIVFWLTSFYFSREDKTFKTGLWVSLFWFFVVIALDFLEIIGPYYMNATLYFSDLRNWLKYPLILLMPVIYSLIMENINIKNYTKRLEYNKGSV